MTVKDDKLVFDISACIADTIIGDLFFRDDEVLANADSDGDNDDDMANTIAKNKTNALKLFVKNENDPDQVPGCHPKCHAVRARDGPRLNRHVVQASSGYHPARQGPYQDGDAERHERPDRWPVRPCPGRR